MPTATVELFTDGAFRFSRRPGFGWVAVEQGRRCLMAQGCGAFSNDGSNNFAAEARAMLEALRWAFTQGYRSVWVHTDFATMAKHLWGAKVPVYREARALRDFVQNHPEIALRVIPTPSSNPHLTQAHHLARATA